MEKTLQNSHYIQNILNSGFLVRLCEKTIRNDWELHYHNELEIYYLVEGKCKVFVDNKVYDFRAGDMAIVPPGIFHKVCYESNVPVTRFVVSCSFSSLPQKIADKCLSAGGYIARIPGASADIESILFKLKKEYDNLDDMSHEMMSCYVTFLITLVSRLKNQKEYIEIKSSKKIIEMAVTYVKENFSTSISLEDIARHVSVSSVHLSRVFKAETGFGLNEYITLYRLKQAEFLLSEHHEKSISEIAYDCGFNDSNYFSIRFKKFFGVTPSEHREAQKMIKN